MTKVRTTVVNNNSGSRGSQPSTFDECDYSCQKPSTQYSCQESHIESESNHTTHSPRSWMSEGKSTRSTDTVAVTSDESAKVVMAEVERTTRMSRASIDDSESDRAVGGTVASPPIDEADPTLISAAPQSSEAVSSSAAAGGTSATAAAGGGGVGGSSAASDTAIEKPVSEDERPAAMISHEPSVPGSAAVAAPSHVPPSQPAAEPTSASMIADLARAMSPTTTATAKSHVSTVYRDSKCCKLIFSFLPLSQTIAMSQVSRQMQTMVKRYYSSCAVLDLSEFYGVIGSTEFDGKTFYSKFLRSFESVQCLKLRFCTNLKSAHLDRILDSVTPSDTASTAPSDDESGAVSGVGVGSGGTTSDIGESSATTTTTTIPQSSQSNVNLKLTKVNLYYCSRLGPGSLFKLLKRCPNLRSLNIGRCHAITAKGTINAFKALLSLPLESLTFSLDPSVTQDTAEDLLSLLIHEDNFKQLKNLDLSQGCEILCSMDLSDLNDKDITVKLPHRYRGRSTGVPSSAPSSAAVSSTASSSAAASVTTAAPSSSSATTSSTATVSASPMSASATPAAATIADASDKSVSPDLAGSSAAAVSGVVSSAAVATSKAGGAAASLASDAAGVSVGGGGVSSSLVDTRTVKDDASGVGHRSGSDPPSSAVVDSSSLDGGAS